MGRRAEGALATMPPPAEDGGGKAAAQRRNRLAILGFEFLWGLGVPFVQSSITLPGYLSALGAPGFLIGLVPAMLLGGLALVQPFSLYLIQPGPGRFRRVIRAYRLGGLCYLAMAAAAFLLPASAVGLHLVFFFTFYAGFVFCAGMGDPHYIGMVVAAVSERERGRFFGYKLLALGLGALIGSFAAAPVLAALPAPRNFSLSILIGGAMVLLSTVWFALLYRDAAPAQTEARPRLGHCLAETGRLCLRRRAFTLFIIVGCLFVLAQGPYAFLSLFIKQQSGMGDAFLGRLNIINTLSGLIFAVAAGYAGDHFGHRRSLLGGLALFAIGMVWAMAGASALSFLVAFCLVSAYGSFWHVNGFNLGYQCSGEPDPARVYVGLNLATVPLRMIGPLAAGASVDRWGESPVFAAAAALTAAALVLALFLPEQQRGGALAPGK